MVIVIKCPYCGSGNIQQSFLKENSSVINTGLPDHFIHVGWFYFNCLDCFDKYYKGHRDVDFIFTVVERIYFIYIHKQKLWVAQGITREVVEFT